MIACVGDPETVREIAAGHDRVALAAVNAPRNLVFSGAADRIAALRGDLERKGSPSGRSPSRTPSTHR